MPFPVLFQTAARVIQFAYEDAGKVGEGVSPNSEQIARGFERLYDVVNFLQTQGLKLWAWTEQEVALVAGQRYYTMTSGGDVDITKPMRAFQGYVLDSNDNKRPIYPISWDEWMRIGSPAEEGPITNFFVDKQYNQLQIGFWLIPDATEAANSLFLLIQQQIENVTSLTAEMMFPLEWFLALRWGLAADLATGQPEAIVNRCEQRAERFRMALENWDVEDTPTQFTPDPRAAMYNSGAFR